MPRFETTKPRVNIDGVLRPFEQGIISNFFISREGERLQINLEVSWGDKSESTVWKVRRLSDPWTRLTMLMMVAKAEGTDRIIGAPVVVVFDNNNQIYALLDTGFDHFVDWMES